MNVRLAFPEEYKTRDGYALYAHFRIYISKLCPEHRFEWIDTGFWIPSHVWVDEETATLLIIGFGFKEARR